jgi:hypothetical protein
MAVHVPLNDAIKAAGDPDHITNVGAVRDAFHETRWVAWNIVRAVVTTAAFVCLTWAFVLHGRDAGHPERVQEATAVAAAPTFEPTPA